MEKNRTDTTVPADDHDHVFRYDGTDGWCNTYDRPTWACLPTQFTGVVRPARRVTR